MFGQLWVVDPLDGLGFGDGVAANAGAASTKAAIATTARINGRAKRRSQDVFGVGGIGGVICSFCSGTLIRTHPQVIRARARAPFTVARQAESRLRVGLGSCLGLGAVILI